MYATAQLQSGHDGDPANKCLVLGMYLDLTGLSICDNILLRTGPTTTSNACGAYDATKLSDPLKRLPSASDDAPGVARVLLSVSRLGNLSAVLRNCVRVCDGRWSP